MNPHHQASMQAEELLLLFLELFFTSWWCFLLPHTKSMRELPRTNPMIELPHANPMRELVQASN
jgi:hypothetical protein